MGQITPKAQPGGMKPGFSSPSNHGFPYPEPDSHPLADPARTIAGTEISAIRPHGRVGPLPSSSIMDRSKQELLIAFGPGDRALGDADNPPPTAFDPV